MKDNPAGGDKELKELLTRYNNFKSGTIPNFLEEESFERIIDYYDENDQLTLAIEAAERGMELYPFSSTLLIKKADLLIAAAKFSEALSILEQAGILDQTDVNYYILKVEVFLGLNMPEKAKALFEEACALFDEEGSYKLELLFNLTDVFDDYEQYDEVFYCLKLILEEDPVNEEALYKICFWTDFTGKFEESVSLHHKLIEKEPYNQLSWYNLGTAFQGLKLYEKAIDAYLYAIAIDEKFDYAYRNLGEAYIKIKNYKEAAEALEKVLELSIPEDVIYEALGHCYENLNDCNLARSHYRKAIHLKPEDSHLYYHLAGTYMRESNWKKAIQQLDTAIQINQYKPDYQYALALCNDKLGKVKEAVASYISFISARPKCMKGWKGLIECLNENNFIEQALIKSEEALQITRKPVFLYYKAVALFNLGKGKEGLLTLEEAIIRAPKKLKRFIALNPSILQRSSITNLINTYMVADKKQKKKK